MATLTRSAVRVYAVLDALSEGSSNPLEALSQFLFPVLAEFDGSVFNPREFAKTVRERFRLNFTADVAEEFIPIFASNGWISRVGEPAEAVTYTVTIPSDPELSPSESSSVRDLQALAERFSAFCEELSPLTAPQISVDRGKEILIEWLLYIDAYSEANLNFKKRSRKDSESGKLTIYHDIPELTSLTSDEKYLCARFAREELESSSDSVAVLIRLASIGLLTEALQDFIRPVRKVERTDLKVYLDAPVLLAYLGVSGGAERENVEPLIRDLQALGADVRVFSHSVDEAREVLGAVLKNQDPYGQTAEAMRKREVDRSFVEAIFKNLDAYAKEAGVQVDFRSTEPQPDEASHFSLDAVDNVSVALRWHKNVDARERDTKSVSKIMYMRKGHQTTSIFDSRFLMISANGLLAQSARRACIESEFLSNRAVPPVVHRRQIATAVWLNTGFSEAGEAIPKAHLLAACDRVLTLNMKLVDRVREFAGSLSEDKGKQLELLLSQDRSVQVLQDQTLGASSVVTGENIGYLFEKMVEPYREDARKDERNKGKKRIEVERKKLEKERAERENAEKLRLEAELEREAERKRMGLAVDKLVRDANFAVHRQRRFAQVASGVLALFSAYLAVASSGTFWEILVEFGLVFLFGAFSLFGWSIPYILNWEKRSFAKINSLARDRAIEVPKNLRWDGKELIVDPITHPSSSPR